MQQIPKPIYFVAVVAFLSSLGVGIIAPALPSLGSYFHVGIAAMTLAISGLSAARLLTNLFLIRFMSRWPIRNVMIFGLLAQGCTTIVSAISPEYGPFIVFRSLAGIGSGAFTIASTAMLIALAPSAKRATSMGIYTGSVSLGTVSGPAIGAALTLIHPTVPLLSYGVVSLIAGVVATFALLNEGAHRTVASSGLAVDPERAALDAPRGTLRTLLTDRRIVAALSCQFVVGWVFYGLRASYLPAYLEGIGYGIGFVGAMLALAAVCQVAATPLGALLSDRWGRISPLLGAFALTIMSLTAQAFSGVIALAIVAFVLVGLAGGLVSPSSSALLADSPLGRTSAAAGVFWIVFDTASILGPLATGVLAESLGPQTPFIVSGVVVLVAGILTFRARTQPA